MGADNWGVCPRCLKIKSEKKKALIEKAEKGYGKISSSDYIKLVNEAAESNPEGKTLREAYVIYTNSAGKLSITYSCQCKQCGFEYEFKHKEQLI